MSARLRSRAFLEGRVKALRRLKQPMTLVLESSAGVRSRVALQALLRRKDWDE